MEKWEAFQEDWGRKLVREYPSGIPDADPEGNGEHRFSWAATGWAHFTVSAAKLGKFDGFEVDGKSYRQKSFNELDQQQRTALAKSTLNLAEVYWHKAKKKIDIEDRAERQLVDERLKKTASTEEFLSIVAREISPHRLQEMHEQAKEELRLATESKQEEDLQLAKAKVQGASNRIIRLERRSSNWNWVFGIATLISLVVGVYFGIEAMTPNGDEDHERIDENSITSQSLDADARTFPSMNVVFANGEQCEVDIAYSIRLIASEAPRIIATYGSQEAVNRVIADRLPSAALGYLETASLEQTRADRVSAEQEVRVRVAEVLRPLGHEIYSVAISEIEC